MIKRLNTGHRQENHKDEIKLMSPPCNNGGGIIDINELPNVEGSWIGTPLTEDAFKEESMPIYINTDLSKSKVDKLLNNILDLNSRNNYTILSWNGSQPYNLTIEHEDGVAGILLQRAYSNDVICIYNSAIGVFEIPDDLKGEIHFHTLYDIGQYNTELSSLFSSTPFVYKEPENKIDPNAIYRLPDGTLWLYKDGSWVELSSSIEVIKLTSMFEIPEDLEDDKFYKVEHSRIQSIQAYEGFYNNGELTIEEIVRPTSVPLVHITKDIDFNTIYTEDMLLELLNGNEFDLDALFYSYSFIYKEDVQKISYINDFYDDNDNFVGYKLYEDYIDLNNEEWCEGDSTDPYWLLGYRYINSKEEITDPNYVYMIIPDTGLNTWIIPKSNSIYNVLVEYPEGNIISSYRTPINLSVTPTDSQQQFYSTNDTYIDSVLVLPVPTEHVTVKSTSERQHIYRTYGKFIDYVIVEPVVTESKDMLQTLVDVNNSCSHLFYGYSGTSLNFTSSLDTSKVTTMECMFYQCKNLTTIPQLNTSNVTTTKHMFYECKNLTSVPQLDTSKVTTMESMFGRCSSLTTIPQLNASNVTDMANMFSGCTNLTSVPQLDTSKVTRISGMFSSCSNLTTIPQLDTSNVTDMLYMFSGCTNLTTVPALDTSNVTRIDYIFQSCKALKSILMYGMKIKFDISVSTQFEREDLVTILNNLATVTSSTTLTMGSTNLAKLTDDDKAIATNKGWTLA